MDIIQLSDRVEALVKGSDIDGYEIMASSSRNLSIEVKEGKVDTFKSAEPIGVSIRLLKNGSMGFSFSSGFEDADLTRMIESAAIGARMQSPDPAHIFPDAAGYAEMPHLFDQTLAAVSTAEKVELTLSLERLTLAADSRIKRLRKASYGESVYSIHLRNSNSVFGSYSGTMASCSVAAIAEADGDAQMGWDYAVATGPGGIDISLVAAEAARKAVSQLGAVKIAGMKAPAVFDAATASELLGLLSPSFSGESLFKGKSLLKGREGEQLFSPLVSIVDDGTLPGATSTAPFDGEGVPTRRTSLVSCGVLEGFLFDSAYAVRMGKTSTGNSARGGFKSIPYVGVSNLFIENGQSSLQQLFSGISRGLLITSLIGMHTANPVSGDFSVGANGLLIENGQITSAVKGMAISGNILEIFANIDAVADNRRLVDSVSSPAFRVSHLDISGS
ncbi:MAG: TldD/PmbA family protein [Geobacteraceae bacterium]|nr:TldD/PmbA family protein [Geobacteraceae bacterium]